jgi:hypothetical protein
LLGTSFALVLALACGGSSNSEILDNGGSGGTGTGSGGSGSGSGSGSGLVSGMSTAGTLSAVGGTTSAGAPPTSGGSRPSAGAPSFGGSSGGGPSPAGGAEAGRAASTGGAAPSGGQSSGDAGSGGCGPKSKLTLATHIVMNITWPDTLATTKGSGQFHLWNVTRYDVNGNALTGETRPCGSVLPPLNLSLLAGSGKALIEIPETIWDLETMPKFPTSATLAGWTAGSKFVSDATSALVGLTMATPTAAWPAKGNQIMAVDHDGDSKPGIKGIPKTDGGFVRTPTSIAGQGGPLADQVYLVTRTAVSLDGAMTSCEDQKGVAKVMFFDNHVVGCHVFNGDECTAAEADFIDSNRTIYTVTDASYTSKFMSESATCAEVRAALPL